MKSLSVKGVLPADLNGEFVRTGPNNKLQFSGAVSILSMCYGATLANESQYHWFDGDGMLHGLFVQQGEATYVNRWVRTKKLETELAMGTSLAQPSVGDLIDSGASGVLGFAKIILFSVWAYLSSIVSNTLGLQVARICSQDGCA